MSHIGLNCFFNCTSQIAKNEFGIEPGYPHCVFVFDAGKGVDGFLEVGANVSGSGCGYEGGYVEEMAFWGGVG